MAISEMKKKFTIQNLALLYENLGTFLYSSEIITTSIWLEENDLEIHDQF